MPTVLIPYKRSRERARILTARMLCSSVMSSSWKKRMLSRRGVARRRV